jgi:hypothetical protein
MKRSYDPIFERAKKSVVLTPDENEAIRAHLLAFIDETPGDHSNTPPPVTTAPQTINISELKDNTEAAAPASSF